MNLIFCPTLRHIPVFFGLAVLSSHTDKQHPREGQSKQGGGEVKIDSTDVHFKMLKESQEKPYLANEFAEDPFNDKQLSSSISCIEFIDKLIWVRAHFNDSSANIVIHFARHTLAVN